MEKRINEIEVVDAEIVTSKIKNMKSGVELISEEREKQISKHGFTGEHHFNKPEWYEKGQLIEAANTLSMKEIKSCLVPFNWDIVWFSDLCNRPYKERLVISGALIASEIDRLNYSK